jgi:hypothetical protein
VSYHRGGADNLLRGIEEVRAGGAGGSQLGGGRWRGEVTGRCLNYRWSGAIGRTGGVELLTWRQRRGGIRGGDDTGSKHKFEEDHAPAIT